MKFIVISDTHSRHRALRVPPGDVLIHCGDVSYRGEVSEIEDFISWFSRQPHTHKIFIAGNHDFFFEKARPSKIEKMIPDNITYLKDSGTELGGIRIWGSPYTPFFYNWAFNKQRGVAMHKQWSAIPDDTDILITHGPPFGILDNVLTGQHAGCRDLLNRINEVKPKAHLFGHIHEGYGRVIKNGTIFMNASVVNEGYEVVNKPFVFEM
jgi:Icc-related predicted phosphoesterase